MSRNTRKQHQEGFRKHAIPTGGVGLDQVEAADRQKNAIIQQKVESIAAIVYGNFVGQLDTNDAGFENECAIHAGLSIDAALVFAREIWGVEGRREKRVQGQPPQPIVE